MNKLDFLKHRSRMMQTEIDSLICSKENVDSQIKEMTCRRLTKRLRMQRGDKLVYESGRELILESGPYSNQSIPTYLGLNRFRIRNIENGRVYRPKFEVIRRDDVSFGSLCKAYTHLTNTLCYAIINGQHFYYVGEANDLQDNIN